MSTRAGERTDSERKYGRDDVDFETWYNPWMKRLARQHSRVVLEAMLLGSSREASRAGASHLRAIERTTGMTSNAAGRAHTRNVVAAAGDRAIAIRGAIEIHDLFPEHAAMDASTGGEDGR